VDRERKLREQVEKLQNEVQLLQNKLDVIEGDAYREAMRKTDFGEVVSEYCLPTQLHTENLAEYCREMMEKYPALHTTMDPLFSKHWRTKEKSSSTDSHWLAQASLYKAFIIDMILKSKNQKAVMRTNLMLGVYFYQLRLPESAWKILQRLRILPTIDTVEVYLIDIPEIPIDNNKLKMVTFDNCDIHHHTNKPRSEHQSQMLHLVTRAVFQLPQIPVTQATLFKPYTVVEAKKFARWIVVDYDKLCELSAKASEVINKAHKYGALKFALKSNSSAIPLTKVKIMEVDINRQTISYDDVKAIVLKLYEECGKPDILLANGDFQTYDRMYHLKILFPGEFDWLVPIPGEWHWNWHILQGIYKIWSEDILRPLSQVIGFKTLDPKCKNFHHGEDFLELATLAIHDILCELRVLHPDTSDIDIMHHYKEYTPLYELLYFYNWHAAPYWHTRAALKSGFSTVTNQMWRYWLHLFIAAGKTKYSVLSLRVLWSMRYLHDDVVKTINKNRLFSFSGKKDTGIPLDGFNELV